MGLHIIQQKIKKGDVKAYCVFGAKLVPHFDEQDF